VGKWFRELWSLTISNKISASQIVWGIVVVAITLVLLLPIEFLRLFAEGNAGRNFVC
jgi:hypothetical protein